FLQTVRCAPLSSRGLFRTAVLLALGALHVFGGFLQPVQSLLQLRRSGSRLARLLAGLLALLALLSFLPLLALLALLTLLPLLLLIAALQLLHLFLEF